MVTDEEESGGGEAKGKGKLVRDRRNAGQGP
jgi:hypothetical protein